jgi:ABC-type nitrate/sulfonate/bicarbonate transport system substrate-binding protein
MRKSFCFAGIVLLFIGASLPTPDLVQAQAKTLEPVKIGYSGIGIAHDLMKIMEKNRIFEKYGLNAQGIYIGSGSLMNQAIVGGSIQFTTSDLPSQIQAALSGIDFKIISVTIDRLDGAIMARKEIRKPEDLKGSDWRSAVSALSPISSLSWYCAIGNSTPKGTWRSCRWATHRAGSRRYSAGRWMVG